MSEATPERRDSELELRVLLEELRRLDEEKNNAWAVVASLIVVAGASLAVFTEVVAGFDSDWLWAVFALLPPLMIGYTVVAMCGQVMRSYYTRNVERRVSELAPNRTLPVPLPTSALETMTATLTSNRTGDPAFQTIMWTIYITVSVLAWGASIYSLSNIGNWSLAIGCSVIIGVLAVACISAAARFMFNGAESFLRVAEETNKVSSGSFPRIPPRSDERRLISYLLLPRPNDLLVKGVGLHLSAGMLGALLAPAGLTRSTFVGAAATFVLFEVALYQARYMLNDYFGKDTDSNHRQAKTRRRLPPLDSGPRVGAFWLTIILRCLAVSLVPFVLIPDSAVLLLVASGAVVCHMIIYEVLRKPNDGHGPLSTSWTSRSVAIVSVVGATYALRVGLGLYIGGEGTLGPEPLYLAAATFYLSGTASVLMVWVLETTEFALAPTDRSSLRSDRVTDGIRAKAHLLPIGRSGGLLAEQVHVVSADVEEVESLAFEGQSVLHDPRFSRPSSVWSILVVASCGVAMAAGASANWSGPVAPRYAAVFGLLLGAVLVWYPKLGTGAAVSLLTVGLVGQVTTDEPNLWFVGVPLAAVAISTTFTRASNYNDTQVIAKRIGQLPGKVLTAIPKLLAEIIR